MKKVYHVIFYTIGLLFLISTIGHRMLITSDIPPVYTVGDLYTNYILNFITFVTWLIIFKTSNNEYLFKLLAKLTPILFTLFSAIMSVVYGKTTYIYYNNSLFLLDIALLIMLLTNICYAFYKFICDAKSNISYK